MPGEENFGALNAKLTAPGDGAIAVTPNDTTKLTKYARALYVGGAGNVTVLCRDDSVVTFTAVPAGTVLPIRAQRVNATGTTATSIVAIY